jgi:hypothetical protein
MNYYHKSSMCEDVERTLDLGGNKSLFNFLLSAGITFRRHKRQNYIQFHYRLFSAIKSCKGIIPPL